MTNISTASRLRTFMFIALAPAVSFAQEAEPSTVTGKNGEAPGSAIEEVLVTANRRVQNIQEIANSISVLSGDDLERAGADGFEDYIYGIPGADFTDDGASKKIAIRGIGNMSDTIAGYSAGPSTVGIYLNDTPIQGSTVPDLALYDLQRVEVLKGPQGTLYGEGAQAGAIRMLLNKASPDEFLLKVDVGRGKTVDAEGLNRQDKLAVNVPLSEDWAIRLVGSQSLEQGYVDYPNRGTKGENDQERNITRVHIDGEFRKMGISLMGMKQRSRLNQHPDVQFDEAELTNRNTEEQFTNRDFTIAGLTLDFDLGFAELTSASSWYENDSAYRKRFPILAIVVDQVSGNLPIQLPLEIQPAQNEWILTHALQTGIAQELRLVSTSDSWFQWIAGVFYRERKNEFDSIADNDAPNDAQESLDGPGAVHSVGLERFEQYALFGEATLDLPWNLELNLGVRKFRETVDGDVRLTFRGPFTPFRLNGDPEGNGFYNTFGVVTESVTPKMSLSWQVDDWRMLYLTVAKGVRSGGSNAVAAHRDATRVFLPDELLTYEVGAKTQWWNRALTANFALFRNDWEDLQIGSAEQTNDLNGPPVPVGVIVNAGKAYTQGLDFSLSLTPLQGLTLAVSGLIAEGEITEGDPAGLTPDGSNLPQLGNHSYAASIDYRAEQWAFFGITPSFHLSGQRVDDRDHLAANPLGKFPLEGFKTYQARFSFSSARWDASISVNNLTDERTQIGRNTIERTTFSIGRPRTVEARVGLRF